MEDVLSLFKHTSLHLSLPVLVLPVYGQNSSCLLVVVAAARAAFLFFKKKKKRIDFNKTKHIHENRKNKKICGLTLADPVSLFFLCIGLSKYGRLMLKEKAANRPTVIIVLYILFPPILCFWS